MNSSYEAGRCQDCGVTLPAGYVRCQPCLDMHYPLNLTKKDQR